MRVLMLSKACLVGIYQSKLEALANEGLELLTLTPPSWRDERGEQPLERSHTDGYTLRAIPIRFNGSFHLHHYPTLWREMRAFQPHIVHIDEEPYNLATWHALWLAKRIGAKALFFSWQNLLRRYPPPFRWGEAWTLRHADCALAGTDEAAAVLRAKGYCGRLAVIPQFGTSATLFQPADARTERPFTIGFIGRLVPEKGVDLLLRACAGLDGDWRLRIIGGGPHRESLEALAHELGIAEQVSFAGQLPSQALPEAYRGMDALALPSLTRDNWKEQFGRVLVEAMASGVAVVGSDSGAIPGVVGGAGVIVPEGDVNALRDALARLRDDAALRESLIEQGRARLLAHFTDMQIAKATARVYREMCPPLVRPASE